MIPTLVNSGCDNDGHIRQQKEKNCGSVGESIILLLSSSQRPTLLLSTDFLTFLFMASLLSLFHLPELASKISSPESPPLLSGACAQ